VSGLTEVVQNLEPLLPPSHAVEEVSAVHWDTPLLEPEGYGRRRITISYDSEIPDTLGRLKLQSFDYYHLNFAGTVSTGYPTVRASGVHIVAALRATNADRIISASPSPDFNSGIRATWRTSKAQPRFDISLIIEDSPIRRALDARVQRSSIALGILVPILVAASAYQMRRSYRLRRSRSAKNRILLLGALTVVTIIVLIHARTVPDLSDRLFSILVG
jgi:hypothetical protein